jgi:hypothetical protein
VEEEGEVEKKEESGILHLLQWEMHAYLISIFGSVINNFNKINENKIQNKEIKVNKILKYKLNR